MTLRKSAALVGVALIASGCGASEKPVRSQARVAPHVSAAVVFADAPILADGPRTEGEVERTIQANMTEFRSCFEDGLLRDERLHGRITSSIVIEQDGRVSSVAEARDVVPSSARGNLSAGALGRPFPDPQVVDCVHERVKAITFPPHAEGGAITVLHPISFGPEG